MEKRTIYLPEILLEILEYITDLSDNGENCDHCHFDGHRDECKYVNETSRLAIDDFMMTIDRWIHEDIGDLRDFADKLDKFTIAQLKETQDFINSYNYKITKDVI
jgi:hypothetical protein